MSENIQQQIEELREELHQHNYNYYILDEPSISDFEFDAKLKELQDLEAQYPEFNDPNSPTLRVGGGVAKTFPLYNTSLECTLWIIHTTSMIWKIGRNG